jgi:cytochrome o ubiquinol oxidase subunit 1
MVWFIGFIILFTIGGVAGVLLAVPPADFQLHNSLFLVAHFHTMIVSGVLFGYLAGLSYWFPKIFGFKLHDGLGKIVAWCWIVGFILAFVPLYILGLMGATRRLDHYDASLGWQPLFIVAGIGVAIIGLGVGVQLLQLAYSIWKRKELRDTTGDPWNGRTLEWSTVSPAPFYNYAVLPEVTGRDAFWEAKQAKATPKKPVYEDIELPKNTGMGVIIAGFALVFGFAFVWHLWWLAPVGLLGVILSVIIRSTDEHTEYTVTAKQLEKYEGRAA